MSGFHVTVAAVVERDGRYLVVEETDAGERVFNQPAGHLEHGESLLDAVRREVLEETARPFTPSGLVGIYRWAAPTGATYIRFAFTGAVGAAEPGRALDPDIIATHWLSLADLQARETQLRSPLVLKCVHDSRAATPLPLDCLHDLA